MLILGIILVVIAVIVFCFRQFSSIPHLNKLIGSERRKIGETLQAYNEAKQALGDMGEENVVSEDMTVMGDPICDDPLISPLGQKECIYYEMTVKAKRQEREEYRDDEGNTKYRTVTHTDTLDHRVNSTRFSIDDGTGSVLIDPRDGEFEGLVTTVDRSEMMPVNNSSSITFGGFSFSFGNNYTHRRPETIIYEEKIIGIDRRLTVVGNLCDKMGELMIQNNGKSHVLVSTKSHDEMIAESKSTLNTQKYVAIGCGIGGLVLVILGLVL